jgi:hypothetical protein
MKSKITHDYQELDLKVQARQDSSILALATILCSEAEYTGNMYNYVFLSAQ